jgi:hypothetical protein
MDPPSTKIGKVFEKSYGDIDASFGVISRSISATPFGRAHFTGGDG